jgi:hypothetical protein
MHSSIGDETNLISPSFALKNSASIPEPRLTYRLKPATDIETAFKQSQKKPATLTDRPH